MSWTAVLVLVALGMPRPAAQADSAFVRGIVTRIGTGEAVSGAVVYLTENSSELNVAPFPNPTVVALSGRQPQNVTTDSSGLFVIADVEPGEYRLVIYRDGYVRSEYGQGETGSRGTPLTLVAGQELDVSVEIVPTATITGRVYDAVGVPVPHAGVLAWQALPGGPGERTLQMVRRTITDDLGEYRLFWLTPGEYFVSAVVGELFRSRLTPGDFDGNRPPVMGHMSAFYPGVPDETLAVPLTVMAGDQLAAVDVRLESRTAVTIRGRLVGAPISSVRSVPIRIAPMGASLRVFPPVRPDAQGYFEIAAVSPGRYRLWAQTALERTPYRAQLVLEVPNLDIDVTLVLEPELLEPGR